MLRKAFWYIMLVLLFVQCKKELPKPTAIEVHKSREISLPVLPNVSEEDQLFLKRSFRAFINHRRFNGSILVAKNNEIIFDTVVGYADIRRRIPLTDTSAIQLASISKPITAAVLLSLVQEGKLDLKDTVTKYLPRLPEAYQKISIEMLLSHQTGLTQYYYYCDHYLDDKECVLSNDSLIEVINCYNPGFCFNPGRRFDYCNTNYALLAAVSEKIEQKRFQEIIEERIVKPTGMKHSFLLDLQQDTLPSHLVYGNNQWNRTMEFDYLDGIVGDKGFFSTAKDLFLFDQYFTSCLMLEDSLIQLAFEPQVATNRRGNSYGLGWRLRFNDTLGKVIYHPGWWRGNRHLYFKIPSKDYTVIILSNALRGSVYNLNDLLSVFYEVD